MKIGTLREKIHQISFLSFAPFILCIPLLFILGELIWGIRWFDWTELLSCVPLPDRLRYPDGIKELIKVLGLVGCALSYINSAKASRVKGILLSDVISYFYHFYGIAFLFHGTFALLGLYSCEIGILSSSWQCLLGILCCTAYSLYMAYKVVFSPKQQHRCIMKYVKALKLKDFPPKHCRQTAYLLGEYIGERYNKYNIELGRNTDDKQEDEQLLLSALSLLISETEKLTQTQDGQLTWEGPLPKVFDNLHCNELVAHPADALFILDDQQNQLFQNDIRHCAALWANILTPIKQDSRQAELVVDMLWHSPRTASLCCGLVCYMHRTHIQFGNEKKGWQTCVNFLRRIANIAHAFDQEQQRSQQEKVLRCCMDMMLLFFCLACMYEANSNRSKLSSFFLDIQDLIDHEFQRNGSITCYIPITPHCIEKYLYFTYKLLKILAIPEVNFPYRIELFKQIPAIVAAMEQCLQRNPYAI